jgi:hypothetical protein
MQLHFLGELLNFTFFLLGDLNQVLLLFQGCVEVLDLAAGLVYLGLYSFEFQLCILEFLSAFIQIVNGLVGFLGVRFGFVDGFKVFGF